MPYVNKPRPYKKEYQQQLARDEHERRMERQRARREYDKKHPDRDKDGTADSREGKDLAHRRALSRGGSNGDGVEVESASRNRSFRRNARSGLVSETSKRERRK